MNNKNIPDFLIVGAAKAGTTSLHKYLEANENILLTFPKEPKYFSYSANKINFNGPGDSSVKNNIIKSINDYSYLFSTKNNKIAGESSADNLYYFENVIPLINTHLKNPKIIIILRNPIERAFSAYTHLLRDNRETLSFEDALQVEKSRIIDGYEFIWHYKTVGLYSKQVKAYLDSFLHVKIFLFEDLKSDAQKVVDETCSFLGVSSVKINKKKIYNKSGIPKKNWKTKVYNRLIRSDNFFKKSVKVFLPTEIRKTIGGNLKEKLFDNNLVKPQMKPETRQMLIEYYKNDIWELQELINRDLTHWLR